jgi:hypothetical protein
MLDRIDDPRSHGSVADLAALISDTASEYSYFNINVKLHDLSKHLKRTAAFQHDANRDANNNNTGEPNRQLLIKQPTRQRHEEDTSVSLSFAPDLSKYFKVTKKRTVQSETTIENRLKKPIRQEVEREFDFNAKEMFQPFLKPVKARLFDEALYFTNLLIEKEEDPASQRTIQGVDDERRMSGFEDEFDIPLTSHTFAPFVSQNGGEYEQSQQVIEEMLVSRNLRGETARFSGENLVAAPLQVNPLDIEYAKTSKNINTKKLKQVIWEQLCEISGVANGEACLINTTLSLLYERLRPPVLPEKTYNDLSIPIVFQMLTYLATERVS